MPGAVLALHIETKTDNIPLSQYFSIVDTPDLRPQKSYQWDVMKTVLADRRLSPSQVSGHDSPGGTLSIWGQLPVCASPNAPSSESGSCRVEILLTKQSVRTRNSSMCQDAHQRRTHSKTNFPCDFEAEARSDHTISLDRQVWVRCDFNGELEGSM